MHYRDNSITTLAPLASSEATNPLIESLRSRRSVHPRRLVEPGPSDHAIRQIIATAVTATDHGQLRPWRFVAVTGSARKVLGETFVEIKKRREGDVSQNEIQRERERASSVPVLIAIVSRLNTEHPVVPVSEQYISVGAAIQNMLLCAHGLGFGAKMVSGKKIKDQQLAFAFDLAPDEGLVGFLCLGTAVAGTRRKPRAAVEEVLTYWDPNTALGSQ